MNKNWNMYGTSWYWNTKNRLNKIILVIVIGLLSVVILNCSSQSALVKTQKDSLIFSVMGDVPRSDEEKIILLEQIRKHNQYSSAQFVIHVGDIKSGKSTCAEDNYKLVADYLKKFKVPVFIVPGDNEWNDCGNPNQAWDYWNKYFNKLERNWNFPIEVKRQNDYPVNFAFEINDVNFIGINLVGGRIHDQTEWDQMQQNAAQWINNQLNNKRINGAVIFAQATLDEKHLLFTEQFISTISDFGNPVLFIHGDGHFWLYNDSYLVPNMIRVQVDKGGIADPLEVTVNSDSLLNFEFNRNPFNEKDILINNR
ncbi:metallophosphoesterase family protein [Candidatus Neomarinimicrobiota bacterium]